LVDVSDDNGEGEASSKPKSKDDGGKKTTCSATATRTTRRKTERNGKAVTRNGWRR